MPHALLCHEYSDDPRLTVADLPSAALRDDEVRVRVRAAGLNFHDTLMIRGRYQARPALPIVPGSECAGIVTEVGAGVGSVRSGSRVILMTGEAAGCLREEITVSAEQVFEIPASIPMRDAAALPVAYGTAAHALLDRAQAKSGECLVALGAAGGVGMAALQIGKALGMHVIAAAGSQARVAFAIERGADAGIDYTREPFRERVRVLTAGRGADVIVDPVGGALFESCVRSLAWCGRLLVVGFTSGSVPCITANLVLLRSASVLGVFYGAFARRNPERNRELLSSVVRWYQSGSIRPAIGRTVTLEQAPAALSDLAHRRVTGKLVVEFGS